MEKRYYWLKFQSDFFESKRVKKLYKMGAIYLVIYLKMQLKSLQTGGYIEHTGIEEDFATELALDLNEKPGYVQKTIGFLLEHDLLIQEDEHTYFLPWVLENTGSETAATQRWRDWKKRHTGEVLESNKNPTNHQRTANVEKEIDIEIEKEKYKRKSTRKRNPALNYQQSPIDEDGFNRMVVNLDE